MPPANDDVEPSLACLTYGHQYTSRTKIIGCCYSASVLVCRFCRKTGYPYRFTLESECNECGGHDETRQWLLEEAKK